MNTYKALIREDKRGLEITTNENYKHLVEHGVRHVFMGTLPSPVSPNNLPGYVLDSIAPISREVRDAGKLEVVDSPLWGDEEAEEGIDYLVQQEEGVRFIPAESSALYEVPEQTLYTEIMRALAERIKHD